MTAEEHYAEAERLLTGRPLGNTDDLRAVLARAQVHATLALVPQQLELIQVSPGDAPMARDET